MSNITVKIEGMEKLQARLKDPKLVGEPLKELLKEASDKGKAVAKHNLSGGLEMAKISMVAEIKPLVATVFSRMPQVRAKSIEEGRRPGENVSFLQIARWVTKRRHLTARRLAELTQAERDRIEAVQAAIRTGGAKGKAFIAGAREAVKKDLPGMVNKMARKIEERWKQSR